MGRSGEILMAGGLADQAIGYSFDLPFWRRESGESPPQTRSFTAAGVANGPVSGDGVNLLFSPFVALRNATGQPIAYALEGVSAEGGSAKLRFDDELGPYRTRVLELTETPEFSELQGTVNLSLSTAGWLGDLVAAFGSVDDSGDYSFQVRPEVAAETAARLIPFWSVEGSEDTVLNLWNLEKTGSDLVVSLVLDSEFPETLDYPIQLRAGESRQVSFRGLLNQPDQDGNLAPAGAVRGSAYFTHREQGRTFRIASSVGTVNLEEATCSYYCVTCEGYLSSTVSPSSVSVSLNEIRQLTYQAQHIVWGWLNFTSSATWTSGDTNKVELQSAGSIRGKGVTSSPVSVEAKKTLQQYNPNYCAYDPVCYNLPPVELKAQSSVTVPAPQISSISPDRLPLGQSTQVTIQGSGFGPGAQVQVAGSGVTVSVQSVMPNTIQAAFTVTGNPATGTRAVTVVVAGVSSNSQNVTLPQPHHLLVLDDGPAAIVGGCNPPAQTPVARIITLQAVDAAGSPAGVIDMAERYNSLSANTCGNGQPSPSPCGPTGSNSEEEDGITVHCNLTGGSCGYAINWSWQWCGPGSQRTTLGTLDGIVHHDAITVNGYTMPPGTNRIPPNTPIYP